MTPAARSDVKVDDIIKDMSEDDVQLVKETAQDDVTDLAKIGNESPVIRFVNYLIFDAIKQGASDIHIEPKEKQLKIRYRIDGILFEAMNPPHAMQASAISAPEDHGEPRHRRAPPPAGRPHPRDGPRPQDRPAHSAPSPRRTGRSVVMRILDNRSIHVTLDDLGFSEDVADDLEEPDRPAARHHPGHRADRVR